MSTLATDTPLPSTNFAEEQTTTLIPTITEIDTRLDISPVSMVLAVSIVCILSPITVTGNSIILAAFYRYKRLRTASNCLLVSLAISDFGVSVTSFVFYLVIKSTYCTHITLICKEGIWYKKSKIKLKEFLKKEYKYKLRDTLHERDY